jgi:hypothetical protein
MFVSFPFLVYLTRLSELGLFCPAASNYKMIVSDEAGRIWQAAAMAWFAYYTLIYLELLNRGRRGSAGFRKVCSYTEGCD